MFYNVAFSVANYLAYFCKKICCQELSKFAQSGHTVVVVVVDVVVVVVVVVMSCSSRLSFATAT